MMPLCSETKVETEVTHTKKKADVLTKAFGDIIH